MTFALLFPGQGAQYVGMGKSFYEKYPLAKALYDKADQILGFPLTKLCFEGPDTELNLTVNSQPAIYVTSLAIWQVIKDLHPELKPAVTCGLSLGEFSALSAAGSFDFETGLRLVRKRGQWMHESGEMNPGTMCSVIGLNEEGCRSVAESCGVQVANFNSPEQIVLSGTKEGIEKALTAAKEKGAKKVIPLKVSGAFHSRLMTQAQEKLTQELKTVQIQKPSMGFVANVRASRLSEPEDIRANLGKQVTHSVLWTQTIQLLHSEGIRLCLEVGPGRVLKGLAKRTQEDLSVFNVDTIEELDSLSQNFHANIQS